VNILQILKYPDKRLKKPCVDIQIPYPKYIYELVDRMKLTIKEHKALGLSAPQIGFNIKLFVTKDDVFINPIMKYDGFTVQSIESCLSIPEKSYKITRYLYIEIDYLDIEGKNKKQILRKDKAIVCQHEYDHLKGMLINSYGKLVKNVKRNK